MIQQNTGRKDFATFLRTECYPCISQRDDDSFPGFITVEVCPANNDYRAKHPLATQLKISADDEKRIREVFDIPAGAPFRIFPVSAWRTVECMGKKIPCVVHRSETIIEAIPVLSPELTLTGKWNPEPFPVNMDQWGELEFVNKGEGHGWSARNPQTGQIIKMVFEKEKAPTDITLVMKLGPDSYARSLTTCTHIVAGTKEAVCHSDNECGVGEYVGINEVRYSMMIMREDIFGLTMSPYDVLGKPDLSLIDLTTYEVESVERYNAFKDWMRKVFEEVCSVHALAELIKTTEDRTLEQLICAIETTKTYLWELAEFRLGYDKWFLEEFDIRSRAGIHEPRQLARVPYRYTRTWLSGHNRLIDFTVDDLRALLKKQLSADRYVQEIIQRKPKSGQPKTSAPTPVPAPKKDEVTVPPTTTPRPTGRNKKDGGKKQEAEAPAPAPKIEGLASIGELVEAASGHKMPLDEAMQTSLKDVVGIIRDHWRKYNGQGIASIVELLDTNAVELAEATGLPVEKVEADQQRCRDFVAEKTGVVLDTASPDVSVPAEPGVITSVCDLAITSNMKQKLIAGGFTTVESLESADITDAEIQTKTGLNKLLVSKVRVAITLFRQREAERELATV